MKFRPIENKEELWILIQMTLEEQKEPFTLGELLEEVFSNEAFNNFCSKEDLQMRVAEVVSSALNCKVISQYPQIGSFDGKPKFVVIT